MELILAEQLLLIALDDASGRDTTDWGSDAGLAGALLLDLARGGLVATAPDGALTATAGDPPGHDVLRDAYATIREEPEPRAATWWVERLPAA